MTLRFLVAVHLLIGLEVGGCVARSQSGDEQSAQTEAMHTSASSSAGRTDAASTSEPADDAATTRSDDGTSGVATDGEAQSSSVGESTTEDVQGMDEGSTTTGGDDVGVDSGGAYECQITRCSGKIYDCGDCNDNDGDGLVDAADPDCLGPCDNNESGWTLEIPGQNTVSSCVKTDCYFDQDSGSGNDDCYYALACDPLEPSGCTYNPSANIPGTAMTCTEAAAMQSPACDAYCGPIVPNGCDCFGCCEVTVNAETYMVYLGTTNRHGTGTCNPGTVTDPQLCHPCTQTPGCLNACDASGCEICVGDTALPPGCTQPSCPSGVQPCLPEHASGDCPAGMACITGCCVPFPL